MKRTLFVNLGQFVQPGAQLHVWLQVNENATTTFKPDVLSRASVELYNAMIHNQQIRKNDYVLVFVYQAGVLHSTQVSHIDFPGLVIQDTMLGLIWHCMKNGVRPSLFQLMRMDFEKDGETVHCCQTMEVREQSVALMIATCLSMKVNTMTPLVCHQSQNKIVYLT